VRARVNHSISYGAGMMYTLDKAICYCHGHKHQLSKACLGSDVLAGRYISRTEVDTFWKRLRHLFGGY
jgi:hypothetical protein